MTAPPAGLRREDFHIAVICAVSCEYDAVTLAFDEIWKGAEVHLGNAPGDYNKYKVGRIANRNAVLLLLSGMGKVNAASAAASLRSSYTEIKLAMLAGICGGVPGVGTDKELMLGDVIISRCIVQYDLGRRYGDRFATKDTIEDSLGRPHESVRSLTAVFETNSGRNDLQRRTNEILEDIQGKANNTRDRYQRPPATDDCLFEPEYLHRHHGSRGCGCSDLGACEAALKASCDELQCDYSRLISRSRLKKRKIQDTESDTAATHELRIVVGRLGSGDTVMKSGLDRDRIAGGQGFIAFEMEAAGIWDRFPCIIVKAVCDYADSHKNKTYQGFASARAASATKAILEAFPYTDEPTPVLANDVHTPDAVRRIETADFSSQKIPNYIERFDENDRKLLQLLASNHEAHKNFNPERVAGTCEWFFKDHRYCKWLQNTPSSILWVSAGPGCGKSVLARALVDGRCLSTGSTTAMVCHFFFKDGDDRRVNSYDALSAILHQIFTQDKTGSLINHAHGSFKNYGDTLRQNFGQLWNVLLACARNPEGPNIVCVMDALDECSKDGRKEMLSALQDLYDAKVGLDSSLRLKFLITSRPYDDLEISFERMGTKANAESFIRFDGDDKSEEIRHEIDLVIDHKVNTFGKDFPEEHRRIISERLKAMENRTYLWLYLILGIIDERPSAYGKHSNIHDLLSHLPSSVFDAYERILSRSEDQEQARCLVKIVLAATKPLTLDEVNYALTLQETYYKDHKQLEDSLWPRTRFKMMVRNFCGLFISVFDGKVSFIHQTAREFLTTKCGPKGLWKGSFEMPSAHSTISTSCIRMLSLQDADTMIEFRCLDSTPHFMKYAASNWVTHYNSQDTATKDEFCRAARELCRTVFGLVPLWAQHSRKYPSILTGHDSSWIDLTFASYVGLPEVVEYILEKEKTDVNSQDGHFGTPIKAAAASGHAKLIKIFLQHDAECDSGGGRFQTAIAAAVAGEHADAVSLLVTRGSRITQEVMIAAAAHGKNEQQLAYLIETYRDDVIVTEKLLEAATSNSAGGAQITSFLLERHGEDFQITAKAIENAASNHSVGDKIIALLLERRGDEFQVTERMMENAANNSTCGMRIVSMVIEKRRDEVRITEKMLVVAAANSLIGCSLLSLVLDTYKDRSITAAVVESAATTLYGSSIMTVLMEKRGHQFTITPKTMINAARNYGGQRVIDLLLEKRRDEVEITQEVIMAAAEAGTTDLMKFFLGTYEDVFKLTRELILAVANNIGWGEQIMVLLVERFGAEVIITQEVIVSAAGSWRASDTLAMLLDRGKGDVKVTEEVLIAAAANQHDRGPMAFLLTARGAEVKITLDVVLAAKKNLRRRREVMKLLWAKCGDEMELYESYCK